MPDSPPALPRLMIRSKKPLSPEAIKRMEDRLNQAIEAGKIPVLEGDVLLYQLVKGRWELLEYDG